MDDQDVDRYCALKGLVLRSEIPRMLETILETSRSASSLIVEVGTFQGRTAHMIAAWLEEKSIPGAVISIDVRDTLEDDVKTTAAVVRRVAFVRMPSVDAAKILTMSAGFIFIDGCHCIECVHADARAWAPKVALGGVIAFHDARKDGTRLPPTDRNPIHEDRLIGVSAGISAAADALIEFVELPSWVKGHTRAFRRLP